MRISKRLNCTLPENFANRISDLEIKIHSRCTKEDVNDLVALYSNAIEFYESISDQSYIHYQMRLHEILARKEVLAALNPKPKPVPRNPLSSYNSPTNRLADQRKVENALKVHAQGSNTTKILAQDNIKKQEDSFEKKLMDRKNRSRPSSRESSRERPTLENFEKELEKLLERLVSEKIKRIEGVNIKYEKLISEAKKIPFESRGGAIREIEVMKAKELKELASRIDVERKVEITALKNLYV